MKGYFERVEHENRHLFQGEHSTFFEISKALEKRARCGPGSGEIGAEKRHAGHNKLKAEAVDVAKILWQQPEHCSKLHHEMTDYLLNEYSPDGKTCPFMNLNRTGLKKKLVEHLKETDQTEKIFGYTPPVTP